MNLLLLFYVESSARAAIGKNTTRCEDWKTFFRGADRALGRPGNLGVAVCVKYFTIHSLPEKTGAV